MIGKFLVVFVLTMMVAGAAQPDAQKAQEAQRVAFVQFTGRYKAAQDKVAFLIKETETADEDWLVWLATELGKYEDPRAVEELKKLVVYNQKPSEDRPSIRGRARTSLETIEFGPDQRRLASDIPLAEKLGIVLRYIDGSNDTAREAVRKFLCDNVKVDPEVIVPILIEHVAYGYREQPLILQYPEIAAKSLMKGLRSPSGAAVEGSIQIAVKLKRTEFLPQISLFLCADRSENPGPKVSGTAWAALKSFGDESIPWLANVLYSWNLPAQYDAVTCLRNIGSVRARETLEGFRKVYSHAYNVRLRNSDLAAVLDQSIRDMEGKK